MAGWKRFRAIRSSNYDINNTCNLTCEGCYYFVSGQKTYNRRPSAADYDAFFAAEAARGVNYPQFSGGEPSLNPAALQVAAKHWEHGIIYTNGVKKVPADVPFRIAVSVWGARGRSEFLRGLSSYDQAFETAKGDPRAVIYFTINRQNIDDIPEVVEDCVSAGVKLSFNDFAMTTEYIRILNEAEEGTSPYVRQSQNENPSLRMEDRLRAADIIDRMIDRHGDSILYSKLLNDFVHRSPAIYEIDPVTKVANDCPYLGTSYHRGFGFDLKPLKGKRCCAPEFDCSDCRIHPAATLTLMTRLIQQMRRSETARRNLTALRAEMMRFYFWDWDMAVSHGLNDHHRELVPV